jgi:hypothetical protein
VEQFSSLQLVERVDLPSTEMFEILPVKRGGGNDDKGGGYGGGRVDIEFGPGGPDWSASVFGGYEDDQGNYAEVEVRRNESGKSLPVLKQDMIKINRRSLQAFTLVLCICTLAGFCLLRKPYYRNLLEMSGFFNEKSHFVPLKISGFSRCNSPQIEVEIENHIILSEIDLGWRGGIALPSAILHNFRNKTYHGRYSFCGLKGRMYESDIYDLPHIHIGKMKIFPM